MLRRALEIQEKSIGPSHVQTAMTVDELAGVLARRKRYKEAERLYQRAIGILERFDPDTNSDLAGCIERYSALLRDLDRAVDAEKLDARAATIRENLEKKTERARDTRSRPEFRGFR